jgi:hypothetical protein
LGELSRVRRGSGERGLVLLAQARFGCLAFLLALLNSCAKRDYIFSVTGVVRESGGTALSGARVMLRVQGPVYQGVKQVREFAVNTSEGGGFVFMYHAHKHATPYVLVVEKAGCAPWEGKAAAPPTQHHLILLTCSGLATEAGEP